MFATTFAQFFIFFVIGISFTTGEENATDVPVVTSTTPFPDEGYNCQESDRGAFAHPIYCEYYYDCYKGVDTLLKCPGDYLFDLRYLGCNYPEYTDCQNRTRPEGYPGTVTPPEGPTTTGKPGSFECPVENGFYPDPEDCTSFYQCFHGIGAHFNCALPLRFNGETNECDFPTNVDCGSRPIPS